MAHYSYTKKVSHAFIPKKTTIKLRSWMFILAEVIMYGLGFFLAWLSISPTPKPSLIPIATALGFIAGVLIGIGIIMAVMAWAKKQSSKRPETK